MNGAPCENCGIGTHENRTGGRLIRYCAKCGNETVEIRLAPREVWSHTKREQERKRKAQSLKKGKL